MITREDIRELSQFRFQEDEPCAVSFYFQPATPKDKSHREEGILAKDLVRQALHKINGNGNDPSAKADLEKILATASQMRGVQSNARAIFAYGKRKFWREFELPPALPATQLFVNRRFHLKPLAALLGAQPRLGVLLLDHHRARFFDLRLDQLTESADRFHVLSRRGKSDGFAGYDAGHAERRVADDALHHFKDIAALLKTQAEKGVWEKLIVGCHQRTWHDFQPYLHPLVQQRLLAHFTAEIAASNDEIREHATRVLRQSQHRRCHQLVDEVLNQAKSHRRGATGLRRVLRSLQLGEVQTLLMSERYHACAVECTKCGYLDSHMVRHCPACGHATRELEDVSDALIPMAIRKDIELFYVKDSSELDKAGNIAALLRFRAARGHSIAAAS
jgi:peptide subunit release factor 1 (eRF1)